MDATTLIYAAIAGIVIASIGLWWFQFVMTSVKKMDKGPRYGVYAAVWLAYFILTLIIIAQTQQ